MNSLKVLFCLVAMLAITTNAFYLQPYNLASFAPLAAPYSGNFGYYPYYNTMPPSFNYGYSLAAETDHNRLRSVAASSKSLQASNREPSGMSSFVTNEARKHARQLVEDYYNQIDIGCGQMNFCTKGYHAQATGESLSDRQWLRVLQEISKDIPNHLQSEVIGKIMEAYEFGQSLYPDPEEYCGLMYHCSNSPSRARSSCGLSSGLCPGIGIACSLCGMFSPESCGSVCTMADLYCGVTGYSCMILNSSKNTTATTKSRSDSAVLASIIAETPAEGKIVKLDLVPETSVLAEVEGHYVAEAETTPEAKSTAEGVSVEDDSDNDEDKDEQ